MRRAAVWTPSVVVMAAIFYLSSLPDPGNVPGGLPDKFLHLFVYAALGASLLFAFADGRLRAATGKAAALAILAGALYGLSDEVHQLFVPHRAFELMDLAADGAGAACGAGVVLLAAHLHRAGERTT